MGSLNVHRERGTRTALLVWESVPTLLSVRRCVGVNSTSSASGPGCVLSESDICSRPVLMIATLSTLRATSA